MISDPKLERVFHRCREQKIQLDKRRKLIRTAMFCPPALHAALCFAHMNLSIVSGAAIMAKDGFLGDYPDLPCFILSMAVAVFAAGETVLENKTMMKISGAFYPIAAVAYTISFSISVVTFRASLIDVVGWSVMLGQIVMVLSCVLSSLLSVMFKRLYAENEALRKLKGYPHFNIYLMSERDLREEEPSDRDPLEDLSPDERLMRERDMNL